MPTAPGPVTADDVEQAVDLAVTALSARVDREWRIPAERVEWDCWETLEHVSTSVFFYATQLVPSPTPVRTYPFDYRPGRPDGPEMAFFARPDAGPAGLLDVLNASGGILASLVRTAAPTFRAHHMWGRSDPEGFASMGVVEVLAHLHDIAGALQLTLAPAEDLCDRTLARLFPHAPTDTRRWTTLLWATGRSELPGHPRLDDGWRWHSEPRERRSAAGGLSGAGGVP